MAYPEPTTEDVVRYALRLSPALHAALVAWARDEKRSLNAQITYVLERAVAERTAD